MLLSMRYLSKNGSFNTLKSPCLINADYYSSQKSVSEVSGCINSPIFVVGCPLFLQQTVSCQSSSIW